MQQNSARRFTEHRGASTALRPHAGVMAVKRNVAIAPQFQSVTGLAGQMPASSPSSVSSGAQAGKVRRWS